MKNIIDIFVKEPALARGIGLLLASIATSAGLAVAGADGEALVTLLVALAALVLQISTRAVVKPIPPAAREKDTILETPKPLPGADKPYYPPVKRVPSRSESNGKHEIKSEEGDDSARRLAERVAKRLGQDGTAEESVVKIRPRHNVESNPEPVRGEAIDAWGNKGI